MVQLVLHLMYYRAANPLKPKSFNFGNETEDATSLQIQAGTAWLLFLHLAYPVACDPAHLVKFPLILFFFATWLFLCFILLLGKFFIFFMYFFNFFIAFFFDIEELIFCSFFS